MTLSRKHEEFMKVAACSSAFGILWYPLMFFPRLFVGNHHQLAAQIADTPPGDGGVSAGVP